VDAKPLAERVTLLPHRLSNLDKHINLIALTPGTSFNSASAEGIAEERVILFKMPSDIWGTWERIHALSSLEDSLRWTASASTKGGTGGAV